MSAPRRRFTNEDKLSILHQASRSGVTKILRENKLSYSVFARWKQQLTLGTLTNTARDLKSLEQENTRLKKIIAEQALELEIKKEQLKRRN